MTWIFTSCVKKPDNLNSTRKTTPKNSNKALSKQEQAFALLAKLVTYMARFVL
jgi:hypothetical protein